MKQVNTKKPEGHQCPHLGGKQDRNKQVNVNHDLEGQTAKGMSIILRPYSFQVQVHNNYSINISYSYYTNMGFPFFLYLVSYFYQECFMMNITDKFLYVIYK